jgi:hypothetical protein
MHADPTAKIEIHLHFPPGFGQDGQAPEHLHVYLGMPPVLGLAAMPAPAAAIEQPAAPKQSGGWLRSALIALAVGVSAATLTSYVSRPHATAAPDPSAPFRPAPGQAASAPTRPEEASAIPPTLLQQLATPPRVTAAPGTTAPEEPSGPEAFGLHP